jgi:hypothetical protein
MTNDEKKAFYELCSTILNIPHEWNDPVPRRTRWNTRLIGNGRFPGFGLIRPYGRQIMVTSKQGTKMFSSCDQVYEFLRKYNV